MLDVRLEILGAGPEFAANLEQHPHRVTRTAMNRITRAGGRVNVIMTSYVRGTPVESTNTNSCPLSMSAIVKIDGTIRCNIHSFTSAFK